MDEFEIQAAKWRLLAAMCKYLGARSELLASMSKTTAAFRRMSEAIAASERRELASHPDIQYLDAQLDGFYS